MLEETIGDEGGLSPAFTHLKFNLIPKITHLQLDYLLATNALRNCEDLREPVPGLSRFWRGSILFPRRVLPSHFCINKQDEGLNMVQIFGVERSY